MATQVGNVIAQARNRHPAFHKRRVPDTVALSYLSDVQSSMLTRAAELDRNRVAIQCSIVFATAPGNTPGVVGAGSGGGLPSEPGSAVPDIVDGDTGFTVDLDVTHAPVLVTDLVVSAATVNTLSAAAPGWTVNLYAGRLVIIVAGTGYGQRRAILSNTASQLTVDAPWDTIPDVTSVFRVLGPQPTVNDRLSVVTELPPKRTQRGYLISLDAQGHPFINLAAPLQVVIDAGIPLPGFQTIIGGSVRLKSTQGIDPLTAPLTIRSYLDRYHWGPSYTCWIENDQLFLSGTLADWSNAVSVDLRMVPDPADFATLKDYVLLPDFASQMLVSSLAHFMAMRCQGDKDAGPIDMQWFKDEREAGEQVFLAAFGSSGRAFAKYVHEVW